MKLFPLIGMGVLISQMWQKSCRYRHVSMFDFIFLCNYIFEFFHQGPNWQCYVPIWLFCQTMSCFPPDIGILTGRKCKKFQLKFMFYRFSSYCLEFFRQILRREFLSVMGIFVKTIACLFDQFFCTPLTLEKVALRLRILFGFVLIIKNIYLQTLWKFYRHAGLWTLPSYNKDNERSENWEKKTSSFSLNQLEKIFLAHPRIAWFKKMRHLTSLIPLQRVNAKQQELSGCLVSTIVFDSGESHS